MRVVALVALAACGSPAAPHATLSSTAPATRREPVLLYIAGTGTRDRAMYWVSAAGGAPYPVTADRMDHLISAELLAATPSGVWFRSRHRSSDSMFDQLVRATARGDEIELRITRAMPQAAVSPSGTAVAGRCDDLSDVDGVCVAPLEVGHTGSELVLAGGTEQDHVVGWRGEGVVVVEEQLELAWLSRSGERRSLGPVPLFEDIQIDPTGAAVAMVTINGGSTEVVNFDDPARNFTVEPAQDSHFRLCWLATATALVCQELHQDADALVVFSPERHVIATDAHGLATSPTRLAFEERNQLVTTDLRGEHRRVLLDIPPHTTVFPVAWLE